MIDNVFALLLLLANCDTCSWITIDEALSMAKVSNQQPQYDSLDVHTSWAIWNADKEEKSDSYTYLTKDTGIAEVINLTQVEVKDGNVYSQKHIVIRPHVLKQEYICQPNIYKCPMQQEIDSFRSMYPNREDERIQMILNHVERHLDRQVDYEVLECWERYGDEARMSVDEFTEPKAKTMDELYQDCVSDAKGVHYSDTGHKMIYDFRVNGEGYVSGCGLWDQFQQDGVPEGFNIIKFEWHPE